MSRTSTITLGDAIRIAIVHSGATLEQIGAALHVTPKTLSRWQRGQTIPRFDDLVRLAACTGYDVSFFADAIDTHGVRRFADTRPRFQALRLFYDDAVIDLRDHAAVFCDAA